MDYDPLELEGRWRERWAESGRYEASVEQGDDDTTFVTVPYPYPSGGMHIGHARTYTVPDVYARYRRQQGDSVLFPIAWHVTGTPIVGAVERLKKGEAAQMESLKQAFGVPDADLRSLETPMGYARYFIEEAESSYKTGMKQLGLSIDWRREFTTNDERYSKFITWQYETLKERDLLEKGLHPVKYCTEQENPVTTHDILEGEEVEFQEYTLVQFRSGERVFPMATLRPETVRGVTNAYIDPDARYVEAVVDGESWVISVETVEKLELQEREVTVEREVTGEEFVGERIENPITGEEVLILPAKFVDPDSGSGVVMSVPAHSPDDYLALQEAKKDTKRLESYGIEPEEVEEIEPVPILSIESYGEIPARDAVEAAGIDSSQDPDLKGVTQELYNREFHQGVLADEYGEYGGEIVEDVRDELKAHFQERGAFERMYDFPEPVISRAGGKVVVAYQDTWFLRYNDAEWKQKAHRVVAGMDTIPENTRDQFDYTIDWLNEWPCIRNYGLGTRLPWDDEFIIEPLSDSTIYMSYYTIAHRISEIPVEELDREFFDALFYGAEAVESPDERALELRSEWEGWYPVDYRCSANDLISNHLSFYLFHHAELFEESKWPQGITTMGMGLLEGTAMSSSRGHVVLPGEAIERYGADTVRFFLLNSAEPWQDFDWRAEQVESTRNQLNRFWRRAQETIRAEHGSASSASGTWFGVGREPREANGTERPVSGQRPRAESGEGERELEGIDRWLLSKLQAMIEATTAAMERFETRSASQQAFYRFEEQLRWYRRRTDTERPGARWTLRRVLETRLRLLAPIVPYMTNELHEQLTGTPAEDAPWPEVDERFVDPGVESEERLIENLTEDITDIVDVTGEDPETIRIYVAADWKREVFDTVVEKGPDQGAVMGEVMQDEDLREKGDVVSDLVGDLIDLARGRSGEELVDLRKVEEKAVYKGAGDFFGREFDASVEVTREENANNERAKNAIPLRPAIHIE